jgi:hypothetical protein
VEEIHHTEEHLIEIKQSQLDAKPVGKRRSTVVMCQCLPHILRVYLKSGVPMMTMIACFIYDLALFMIFSVNILYHDNSILATTELSLVGSCLLFGCLFEIAGRKKIFTGRLCVTSAASLLVPFGPRLPIPIVKDLPF